MGKITEVKLIGFVIPREPSKALSQEDKHLFLSNNRLLQRHRKASKESQEYLFNYLTHYLLVNGETDKLRNLLTDIDFLALKLVECGIQRLQDDFELWEDVSGSVVATLKRVLQLSNAVLASDATQLPEQLLARLTMTDALEFLIHTVVSYKKNPWLRPVHPSLRQPGGMAERVISLSGMDTPHAIAFTPNNQKILVVAGKSLYGYDFKTGRFLFACDSETDDVTDFTVTQDGQYAVATSRSGTITVWHLDTQKQLYTSAAHTSAVLAVASVTGSLVMTASTDSTLKLWDVATFKEMRRFEGHAESANSVFVLQGGEVIVSGGGGSLFASREQFHLKFWEIETGKEILAFGNHDWTVDSVAVADRWVISASNDELMIWDFYTHEKLQAFKAHDMRIHHLRQVSMDKVLSASHDSEPKLWRVPTGENLLTLRGHHAGIADIAVTEDGKTAASVSSDQTLRIWNLEGTEIGCGHQSTIRKIAVAPSGRWIVTASEDGTLKIWNVADSCEHQTLQGHGHWVSDVVVRANEKQIISASWDKTIKVWSLATGEVEFTLTAGDIIVAIVLLPDDKTLVASSIKGAVTLWNLETRQADRQYQWGNRVDALALSPDGETVLSIGQEHNVDVWNVFTGELIARLEGYQDTEALLNAEDDDERLYIKQAFGENMRAVSFLGDGMFFVTGASNGYVSIWDLKQRRKVSSFLNSASGTYTVCVSNDRRYIAAATGLPYYQSDNTVSLWSVGTQRRLAHFTGDAPMSTCAFVSQNEGLVVGDAHGKLHFLSISNLEILSTSNLK